MIILQDTILFSNLLSYSNFIVALFNFEMRRLHAKCIVFVFLVYISSVSSLVVETKNRKSPT